MTTDAREFNAAEFEANTRAELARAAEFLAKLRKTHPEYFNTTKDKQ